MKAINQLKPILSQLTRDELITLASLALALAEQEADINNIFKNPAFIQLMEKDLKDIESGDKLTPFTLDSLRAEFESLKHG